MFVCVSVCFACVSRETVKMHKNNCLKRYGFDESHQRGKTALGQYKYTFCKKAAPAGCTGLKRVYVIAPGYAQASGSNACPGTLLPGPFLLFYSLHSHPPSRARATSPGVHCDPRKQCARRAKVASHETLLSSGTQLATNSQDYDKRICSFCSFFRYTNMVYFRLSSFVLYWVGSSGPGLPGGLVCEANNFRLSSFVSRLPSSCTIFFLNFWLDKSCIMC